MNNTTIPTHIAVIMDGNARWAEKNNKSIQQGHEAGSKSAKEFVKNAYSLGIRFVTLYTFSFENWLRPKKEVDGLMGLIRSFLDNEIGELVEKEIKIVIIGEREKLPRDIFKKVEKIENLTKNFTKMQVNIALSYSSKQELVHACKIISKLVQQDVYKIEEIDEELISKHLYTNSCPDPDLFIRSSGELRISNFLLWQLAYSELFFSTKLWPDFNKSDLVEAINDYNNRVRKFGKREEYAT